MAIDYDELPNLLKLNDLTYEEASRLAGISSCLLNRIAHGKVGQIKSEKKRKAFERFLEKMHSDAIKNTKTTIQTLESMRN